MKEIFEKLYIYCVAQQGYTQPTGTYLNDDKESFEEWFESNQTLIDDVIVKYLEGQGKKIVDIDPIVIRESIH